MKFSLKDFGKVVEITVTSSDSEHLTEARAHYDLKNLVSVKESKQTNTKLSF